MFWFYDHGLGAIYRAYARVRRTVVSIVTFVEVEWNPWKNGGGCLAISAGRRWIGYTTTLRVYWPPKVRFDSDHLVVWARRYLKKLGGVEVEIDPGDFYAPSVDVTLGPIKYSYMDTDFGGAESLHVFGVQVGFYL